MTPVVSVILVNWNTRDLADAAIASLKRHETSTPFEILFVDNASADGSADFIESRHPDVRVVRSPVNGGFAYGNNLGAAHATGEYLLLLNTDTLLTEPVLAACLAELRAHPDSIVGCRLRNADGSLQASAEPFPTLRGYLRETVSTLEVARDRRLRRLAGDATRPVDWICGAFLMLAREHYLALGGLSEEIFMYGEDVEFCWRARARGLRCLYVPSVSIIHYGGGGVDHSSLRALVLSDAGRLRAFARMRGPVPAFLLRLILVTRSALRVALFAAASLRSETARRKARNHGRALLVLAGLRRPVP